jgi:hypothetical protein
MPKRIATADSGDWMGYASTIAFPGGFAGTPEREGRQAHMQTLRER